MWQIPCLPGRLGFKSSLLLKTKPFKRLLSVRSYSTHSPVILSPFLCLLGCFVSGYWRQIPISIVYSLYSTEHTVHWTVNRTPLAFKYEEHCQLWHFFLFLWQEMFWLPFNGGWAEIKTCFGSFSKQPSTQPQKSWYYNC